MTEEIKRYMSRGWREEEAECRMRAQYPDGGRVKDEVGRCDCGASYYRRDKRPLVDPKVFELAEHFLSDLEGDEASEDQKWQLAKVIQDAVEGWFEHG